MTVFESLQGINAYPVPERTLLTITVKRGLSSDAEATQEVLESADFMLAHADVLYWLSMAPNVAQGGQNYSFTDEQREDMRAEAEGLWAEYGDGGGSAVKYGYKGEDL